MEIIGISQGWYYLSHNQQFASPLRDHQNKTINQLQHTSFEEIRRLLDSTGSLHAQQ